MTQPTLEQFLNDVKNHELTIHQNVGGWHAWGNECNNDIQL